MLLHHTRKGRIVERYPLIEALRKESRSIDSVFVDWGSTFGMYATVIAVATFVASRKDLAVIVTASNTCAGAGRGVIEEYWQFRSRFNLVPMDREEIIAMGELFVYKLF